MGQYTVAGSGADCKSAGETLGWFDSNLAHQSFGQPIQAGIYGSPVRNAGQLAQLGRRRAKPLGTPSIRVGSLGGLSGGLKNRRMKVRYLPGPPKVQAPASHAWPSVQ